MSKRIGPKVKSKPAVTCRKPTKEDEVDFTRIVQENTTMHPFTAIRYTALGWLVRTNQDFSFYGNCYNVTEEGMKVVKKNFSHESKRRPY